MCGQEVTYHVVIRTIYIDDLNYTTIVFENLEYTDPDYHYIMAVMFPNWDQKPMKIGDVGYVNVRYVTGGVDQWYNGSELVYYRYTNVIFLRFVTEGQEVDINNIKVD